MINDRLRELRKEHGLTQQDVADYLGFDRTTYTYYEMGTVCPSLETFRKLSLMYKVSISYLVCESDEPKVIDKDVLPNVAENIDFSKTLSKKEKALIIFFRALDEKKQNQLLKRLNPASKKVSKKGC